MPLISIIIPVHNVSAWLPATLNSIQAQSLHDWECIIIDDGSTDDSTTCVPASDSRFRVIRQENAGVSVARNRGLDESRGQYVAFLDGDDIWHQYALERLYSPFSKTDTLDFVWGNFLRFEDKSGIARPIPLRRWKQTDIFWQNLLIANFLPFGALLIRKDAIAALRFDPALRICEDRDWLLRLLKNCTTAHISHTVLYYRQRAGSAVKNVDRFLKDEAAFLERYINDPTVPQHIRRRARSAFAFHAAVLLNKLPGRRMDALCSWFRALLTDPLYTENYMQLVRKLYIAIRRKSIVSEVLPYL